MAMAAEVPQLEAPVIRRGHLAIRMIHGRDGPFTVARLTTSLGVFAVKDPELEQYPKGRYAGESSSATSIRRPTRLPTACGSKSAPISMA